MLTHFLTKTRKYGETPKIRQLLQYLHIGQLHSASFVLYTPLIAKLLQVVSSFVAWGYPSLQTVRELVYKRGYGKVNGERVALTDNVIVEAALGKHNILCTEDIVHEIFNCGPAFMEVKKFLWSFKLNPARGAYVKGIHSEECGNYKNEIDEVVKKMN